MGVFSYFVTRVPTPNKQPFLTFLISSPYFCSDLSYLKFSYILLYCSYLGVAIFYDVMKFEFNLLMLGEYFNILFHYFISIVFLYQNITPIFLHFTLIFFNKKISYYITLCFYHFYFTYSFH